MVECRHKIGEELKAVQSEIKENVQRINSDGKETRTQLIGLEQKEEMNIQPEQNEETNFKKRKFRNIWDNFKYSNIRIIGVPEGEEEEQKIESLLEQIMKENFPNLAKEIDFQEVQEAQRVPKKLEPRKHTPRHIIITLPKMKDKERILKASREMMVTYKGVPIIQSADLSKETLQATGGWKEAFKVRKGKDLHPRFSIQQSYHLEWKGR